MPLEIPLIPVGPVADAVAVEGGGPALGCARDWTDTPKKDWRDRATVIGANCGSAGRLCATTEGDDSAIALVTKSKANGGFFGLSGPEDAGVDDIQVSDGSCVRAGIDSRRYGLYLGLF